MRMKIARRHESCRESGMRVVFQESLFLSLSFERGSLLNPRDVDESDLPVKYLQII